METWRRQKPAPSRRLTRDDKANTGDTDHFVQPKPPPPVIKEPIPDGVCPKCLRPVKPPYTLCYSCYINLDPTAKQRIRLQWKKL